MDYGVREEVEIKTHRDLRVWQKSMVLAEVIYKISAEFPKIEQYGLTLQIRKSSISIPSNIAEGHARHSTKDYIRFLRIAAGSLAELETQLLLARNFKYTTQEMILPALQEINVLERMLGSLASSLTSKLSSHNP